MVKSSKSGKIEVSEVLQKGFLLNDLTEQNTTLSIFSKAGNFVLVKKSKTWKLVTKEAISYDIYAFVLKKGPRFEYDWITASLPKLFFHCAFFLSSFFAGSVSCQY